MNRLSVHLVVNNSIDRRGAFTPAPTRPPKPNGSAADAATMEDGHRLPRAAMAFYRPSPPDQTGWMEFMTLDRSRNDIFGVDHEGHAIFYDAASRAVRTMPTLHAPKWSPISLAVGDSLYVISMNPGPPPTVTALRLSENWYWRSLQPPPYVYGDDDPSCYAEEDDTYEIGAYTVVGDQHIWISTVGAGTNTFDTESGVWSKAGEWALPFSGRAEYVPEAEHDLWFGLRPDRSSSATARLQTAYTLVFITTLTIMPIN